MKKLFTHLLFITIAVHHTYGQSSTLVKDLNIGSGDGFDEWNYKAVKYKESFILPAQNGDNNLELYSFKDGNISIIKDINPAGGSKPDNLLLFKNKIYFIATTEENGREIWCTDGTAEGTVLAIDIISGKESGSPDKLIVANNNLLYFSANNKVYVSDGTQSNTKEIAGFKIVNFNKNASDNRTSAAAYKQGVAFVNKNEKLYQIYYHDGAKLTMLHEFTNGYFTTVSDLMEVSAGLIFIVQDSFTEDFNGVFLIDKFTNKVSRLLNADNKAFVSRQMIRLNNEKAIFYTDKALYISDGSGTGPSKLIDIISNGSNLSVGDIMNHIVIDGKMLIRAGGGFLSDYMFLTDGTVAGTKKIAECKTYQSPMISSGNKAYWFAGITNGFDVEMWEADFTLGTAKQINLIEVSKYISSSAYPVCVENNNLYYNSVLFGNGRELYKLNKDLSNVIKSQGNENNYKLSQLSEYVFNIYSQLENENLQVTQYDLAGRILNNIETMSLQNFELNLSPGVSIIEVKGKSSRSVFRILKTN